MRNPSANSIAEILAGHKNEKGSPTVTVRSGLYTYRSYYFYDSQGLKEDQMVQRIKNKLSADHPELKIVESGDTWQHWPKLTYRWVKFRLKKSVPKRA